MTPHSSLRRAAIVIVSAALLAPLLVAPAASAATAPASEQSLRLWYDEPASAGEQTHLGGDWFPSTSENQLWQQQTLPIGNGNIGATVYGEIGKERLAFNEKTLWTGGPSASRPEYIGGNLPQTGRGGEALREVQRLFAEGQDDAARRVAQSSLVGGTSGYGAYEGYGEISLDYGFDASGATNYERALDLETGTATVSFTKNGVEYTREFFTSYPDNVMVARLTASTPGALDVNVGFDFRLPGSTSSVNGDTLTVSGALADNQLKHHATIKAVPTNGRIAAQGGKLRVADASEIVLYISAGTDYADSYPTYRTGQSGDELAAQVAGRAAAAAADGVAEVRDRHLADFRELFGRVDLRLGSRVSTDPTDDILKRYRTGVASEVDKRTMETLLYQYGRYLSVESSREGTLPSNLQGLWADRYSGGPTPVPWGSDYHMNVNLQMNYWPSYSANLAETATPLVNYIDAMRAPGRVTAEVYAGVKSTPENPEAGFTAHTQNTPFGWTTPGWTFEWGWSPAAVPWILQNVYEYFEYTKDSTYLRNVIYPMMKEATRYYDRTLVTDPSTGRLVSSPAYSPEHGPITNGNFYEQQLVWQLYNDVVAAAETLGVDPDLVSEWKATRDNLYDPVQVGGSGQIKEWFQETALGSVPNAQTNHRHISQLLGLYPGDLISAETPEFLDAAKVSLNARGDEATGWGIAQRLNAWARIGDGDRSLQIIDRLFRTGIYPNLFDTHPPFQIDGNFGYTAGVNEMLMQSNQGHVSVLPALPTAWSEGKVTGLVARGDFELGVEWSEGRATSITVTSRAGGKFVGDYDGVALATVTSNGTGVVTSSAGTDRISFPTQPGATYTITNLPTIGTFATTPTEVEAVRSSDQAVRVSWASGLGSQASYVIERRIGSGDFQVIRQDATGASYDDQTAPAGDEEVMYRVSATLNGVTSKPSSPVKVIDIRGAGLVDDRSPRLSYTGTWNTWEDPRHHDATIKYIDQTTGGESVSLSFVGTGVAFISPTYSSFTSVDFFVDGKKVNEDPYSLYSPTYQTKQEHVIVEGLPSGVHDLKVVATGAASPAGGEKIEFDAIRVLDSTHIPVTGIEVTSATGARAIGNSGGTLPLVATIAPANAANPDVTWTSSDPSVATVSAQGLVTASSRNGSVTITAAASDRSGVTGTLSVRVYGNPESDTVVDDTASSITYSSGWKVWDQDARNLNSTIHYVDDVVGATATHTFTGTGVEVYGNKNDYDNRRTFGAFIVSVDGVEKETIVLNDSADAHRIRLAAITGLLDGPHTIQIKNGRAPEGGLKAELDYLVVKGAVDTADERSALQGQLERATRVDTRGQDAEDLSAYQNALASAATAMNDANASASSLASAETNLRQAIDNMS